MFYAHFVLSKKGPLARIWLAAHWDKKLTKAMVYETNIADSVEAILEPKVKMALRTSGHLLLGVVRIYSRKAKYLLADCNEAFVKIKMAFRPGAVDLPEENMEAAMSAITLPETFHDFDATIADLNTIDLHSSFALNQSRPEDITIREDFSTSFSSFGAVTEFGTMEFDNFEEPVGNSFADTDYPFRRPADKSAITSYDSTDNISVRESLLDTQRGMGDMDLDAPITDDGFGGPMNDDSHDGLLPGPGDDDDDESHEPLSEVEPGDLNNLMSSFSANEAADFMGGRLFEDATMAPVDIATGTTEKPSDDSEDSRPQQTDTMVQSGGMTIDQTTLLTNQEEAFALEPLDVTSVPGHERRRRRRKLIVDEQKGIPSEAMKAQLADTRDIVTNLDLAPPTKKLMRWKETGLVDKLFSLPGCPILSKPLSSLFSHQLVSRPMPDEHQANLVAEDDYFLTSIRRGSSMDIEGRRADTPGIVGGHSPGGGDRASILTTGSGDRRSTGPPSPKRSRRGTGSGDASVMGLSSLAPPSIDSMQLPFEEMSSVAPFDGNFDNPDTPYTPAVPNEDDMDDLVGEEEDAEEMRWSKRTVQMAKLTQKVMKTKDIDSVQFSDLVRGQDRKQVASKFYTFLMLRKMLAIDISQEVSFGPITISKGPKFDSCMKTVTSN